MDQTLKNMFESGKALLTDTKTRKPKAVLPKPAKVGFDTQVKEELDPHRKFVKRVIDARPKKADLVEDIKSFIEKAEALL